MIVLCGIPSEPPLALVIEAACSANLPHAVLNQREVEWTDLFLANTGRRIEGALTLRDSRISLDAIEGVFVRLIDSELLPEARSRGRRPPPPETVEKARVFYRTFSDWLEVAPCRVLNRIAPMGSNASKPYQAQLIRQCGFSVPATLVTNDREALHDFAERHRRIVFKSVSATRSIVREFLPEDMRNVKKLRHLPTQFQAFVPGINVRVHVVGEQVFATEIETEAVDYRYAQRDGLKVIMRPILLDDDNAARCVGLSRLLELPLCGIDLKRTPDGKWVCFEVNPTPAYSYYEEQAGQPIARGIVEYLAGGVH